MNAARSAPDTPALPARMRFIERDWLSANHVLLFDDDGSATLIDTGYDKHKELTRELVRHALATSPIRNPARLTRIVNTHLHSDHCGGNAMLIAEHDCAVLIPVACLDAVRRWDTRALSYRDTAQRCDRFAATGTLACGDRFEAGGATWQVHAAPGHDPTSLMFFDPEHRILISADALWEQGFGVIFPELIEDSGFSEQSAILDLIESLAPEIVIPGHGRVFTDVERALATARSRLAALVADPQRNLRHAIKVLTKFLLLDHERLTMGEIVSLTDDAEMMKVAAASLGMTLPQALTWAVDALVEQHQIRRSGDLLINV